jgi:hypothetical protein
MDPARLTIREFLAACGACDSRDLRSQTPVALRDLLIERLARKDPRLSAKLSRLSDAEAGTLYALICKRRFTSG